VAEKRKIKRKPDGKYIRTSEIAEMLDVHANTVYRMIKRPGFPVLRIGAVTRIPRVPFMAYIATHSTGAIEGSGGK
jgi:excisionase family DNA binding protein